jgi:glycogen synthase
MATAPDPQKGNVSAQQVKELRDRTGAGFTACREALLATVKQALLAFEDQSSWQTLMRNGMGRDFSWGASAREYGKIYDRVRQLKAVTPAVEKILV